jgi:hypothetical protein
MMPDVLEMLVALLDVRGRIPFSGGFEPHRQESNGGGDLRRRLATLIATLTGLALALGGATFLAVKTLQ